MLSAQLEVVFLHVWQDWPSQTAFVSFLAVMRCEMEKAVESVHLWLDETQNNYVKEPNSSVIRSIFHVPKLLYLYPQR